MREYRSNWMSFILILLILQPDHDIIEWSFAKY